LALTFLLLGLAICSVWLPSITMGEGKLPPWAVFFIAALVSGLVFGFLTPVGIIALATFCTCVYFAGNSSITDAQRRTALALTFVLALVLAMHAVPGFNNPTSIEGVRFSPDAAPFKQYLNFDKAAVGLLLLVFLCRRCHTWADWKACFALSYPILIATVSSVLLIAYFVGYVHPDFKLPAYTPTFLATNLLFTCVAEEAFFRGFLQEKMAQSFAGFKFGGAVAIIASALLFGLAHVGGGPTLMLLSTLVGLGSACAYARSRRIEASIVTHFTVNAVHFVFFTYPSLAVHAG
jgi:membrane protease YdiL (CAAX protease family)